jgi:hypothetical protein
MKIMKILGLVAVAAAIVGAFVTIPNLATLLIILGLIGGFTIDAPDHVRVIVSALALTALAGTLNSIPSVGSYLTAIVGNLGVIVSGVAIMIILRNVYNRFRTW